MTPLPTFPCMVGPNANRDFLTPSKFAKLCDELPPHLCLAARFAVLTLLRMRSQSRLTWDRVDLNGARAWVPSGQMKSAKAFGFLLSPVAVRRRRSTLNKVITYLKASLDRAYENGDVEGRSAWARLRKYKGADNARLARLSTEEALRLTNAAAPDFRRLLQLALLTGARYGELIAFRARDFDEGSGTLLVAESKSGKSRRIPLTDEGRQLLESLTAGRTPDDAILTKADGSAWKKNDQFERIREACTAAKISPPINFHAIRHTTASLLVEKGVPLAFVAEMLGHTDARMVSRHYAHLARNIVHDEIRAKLPSFSVRVDGKVTKLRP